MAKILLSIGGWLSLGAAAVAFVHVRNDVVAERYALGEVVRHEFKLERQAQVLREQWERATDPRSLEQRASIELKMQSAKSGQILK